MICENCKKLKPNGLSPNLCPKCLAEYNRYLGKYYPVLTDLKGTFKNENEDPSIKPEASDRGRKLSSLKEGFSYGTPYYEYKDDESEEE